MSSPLNDAIQLVENAWSEMQQDPNDSAQIISTLEGKLATDQSKAKAQGDMETYFAIEGAIGSIKALTSGANVHIPADVYSALGVAADELGVSNWPPS